ncbi:T6SS effector amidase Tae4 family protein [Cystobacter fuscus]
MPKLNFKSLWDNHPAPTIIEPCKSDTGQPNHVNQCAIRMGVALLKANVRVPAISVPNCEKKGHDGHTLGARKLADWMSNRSDLFGQKKPFYQSQKPAENIRGKKESFSAVNSAAATTIFMIT